jgi:quercetin dioxygenase-like cupin family protein
MMGTTGIRRTEKPWGYELLWARSAGYAGKVLHIKAGHRLSLQYHVEKVETILVNTGHLLLQLEDEAGQLRELHMHPGDACHIPAGRVHRMIAVEECDLLEVSTDQLEDVVRLEDSYGRVPTAHVSIPESRPSRSSQVDQLRGILSSVGA